MEEESSGFGTKIVCLFDILCMEGPGVEHAGSGVAKEMSKGMKKKKRER